MLIDLANEAPPKQALNQTVTTAVQGSAVDMHDSNVSLNAVLSVGAVSGTTPSMTVQIEQSATGTGGWSVVPIDPATGAGMVFANVTAGNTIQTIKGLPSQQFIRANVTTVTGTSPSFEMDVLLIANAAKFPDSAPGFDHYPST